MLGYTIEEIKVSEYEVLFTLTNGQKIKMYHIQDCCETVTLEDIVGNITDLIDSPITLAERVSNSDDNADESGTWTYYKLATNKGYVTFRWYGESNGYYSEDCELVLLDEEEKGVEK